MYDKAIEMDPYNADSYLKKGYNFILILGKTLISILLDIKYEGNKINKYFR